MPLRDRLVDGLLAAVPDAVEVGVTDRTAARRPPRRRRSSGGVGLAPVPAALDRSHKVAGSAHLCFPGVESEALLFLLDDAGVAASAGSSCASGAMDPSHVLAACGVDRSLASGALRLSLGWCSTDDDVDLALDVVPAAVRPAARGDGLMARVLVAMSGGVDSSVAAARLLDAGHEVVGVTLKLWGGESDTGCCSVSDVDDARRVADHLGIDHHTFNFGDDFWAHVVGPYLDDHAAGRTPNPCVECNRHLKFDRLLERADLLGFDAVATGHHARNVARADGSRRVARGADRAKDQSYVIHMLDQAQLARTLLPVGDLTKADVRAEAARLGLRTATKPDSQDVCFITTTGGRHRFLGDKIPLTPGRVVDGAGHEVGQVDAVELVTIGQRKGLGLAGGGAPRFAVSVDVPTATVVVDGADGLLTDSLRVERMAWADAPVDGDALVQCSAHGDPQPAPTSRSSATPPSRSAGTSPSAASPPARASSSTRATRSRAAASPSDPTTAHRPKCVGLATGLNPPRTGFDVRRSAFVRRVDVTWPNTASIEWRRSSDVDGVVAVVAVVRPGRPSGRGPTEAADRPSRDRGQPSGSGGRGASGDGG